MNHTLTTLCLAAAMFTVAGCQATDLKIEIGSEGSPAGPMSYKLGQKDLKPGNYTLVSENSRTAAQVGNDGLLWWWQDELKAGSTVDYKISSSVDSDVANGKKGVQLKKVGETIEVLIDNKPFTVLNMKKSESKPYLYPVIGPTGDMVTRNYPMKKVEGERQDHHHHRSIWCAHGSVLVNGRKSNYWHEPGDGKFDKQIVKEIVSMTSGSVFGQIVMNIDWVNNGGEKDLSETRTYTFFKADDGSRMIDATNVFHFTEGDTTFADDKEGGIMALRIATSMDQKDPGKGQMYNSKGGKGANECWGKAASWCDYVGPVNDKTVGIAVFDHPKNHGHPSHWHIRDYGLYAANPFGLSHFEGKEHNGSKTWKKGETAEYNYRVYIHKGDTKQAKVADQYRLYTTQPKIELK